MTSQEIFLIQRKKIVQNKPYSANKSLGQHFLVHQESLEKIASLADTFATHTDIITPSKYALEIGPGQGALTKVLLAHDWHILAIEKDPRSVEFLSQSLGRQWGSEYFQVIQEDVLNFKPNANLFNVFNDSKSLNKFIDRRSKPLCIGNLPYNISSPFLLWFCLHSQEFCGGLFMLQKEVAKRLTGSFGSRQYGRLASKVQLFFKMEECLQLGPEHFDPPPLVDSTVVAFYPTDFQFLSEHEETGFEDLTRLLFSQRRKMLRGILKKSPQELWAFLKTHNILPTSRPEDIPPHVLLDLVRQGKFTQN